jgi:archaellum component FlaG (FlaF/FlaG flagellin family)
MKWKLVVVAFLTICAVLLSAVSAGILNPSTGTLVVSVNPSDAAIYIDGVQQAPGGHIFSLPDGSHTVLANRTGYTNASATAQIHSGQLTTVSLTLTKSVSPVADPGTLSVSANPSDAAIYIDGIQQPQGGQVFLLAAGSHTVLANRTGYTNASATAQIRSGQLTTVSLTLTKSAAPVQNPGTLSVSVNPSNATIYIDGTAQPQGSFVFLLAAGSHSVVGNRTGYNNSSATAQILSGQLTTVSLTLTKPSAPVQNPGTLSVSVNPSNATISIDGTAQPQGSFVFSLAAGSHSVVGNRTGYNNASATAQVKSGELTTLSLTLPKINVTPGGGTGTLVVTLNPSNATLFIDGFQQPQGAYVFVEPVGSHTLVATRTGYYDASATATITAGNLTFVQLNLTRVILLFF